MPKKFYAVELCAGAAGQALGLEQAGFTHAAYVEIDRHAAATLRLNRPFWNVIERDMRRWSAKPFEGVDLLTGGLPCPPFSKAGKQLGVKDDRNLFPDTIRIIDEIRPRAVLIENVRGLLDAVFDDFRNSFQSQLESLGYSQGWLEMNRIGFKPRTNALVWVLACMLLAVGCKKQESRVATSQTIEVTAVKVEPRDVPITFEWLAQTESSRQVEIRARVAGILEKRVYKEGAVVQEGQVMFEMERKPFETKLDAAKADLGVLEARVANARQNLERVQDLSKKNAVSRQALDEAINAEREAAAAVLAVKAKVAEAELNLSYTTIRAPITGLSSFATKHDGSYIGQGENSMLTYVAAIDPIWVKFSASENYWLRLQEEVKAGRLVVPPDDAFDVEVVLADGKIHPQKGRLTFTDLAFSRDTGTYQVRAEVPNPQEDLSPGQFVHARLLGAVRPKAILLPKRAVLQGAKGSFVWVVGPQSKAEFRPIELGDWHGDEWFVNEGLRSGDTVVVDGGIKVQPGATLKVVEPPVQPEAK